MRWTGYNRKLMSKPLTPRLKAILQALLVTFLWSTSWVLIKIGLAGIPALTFAGLRYGLAFMCLLPFALQLGSRRAIAGLSRRQWARLVLLGVLYYAVTQGTQFLGLVYLPALTASLILNFTTIVVALMGILFLSERPAALQWTGIAVSTLGILVYFYPVSLPRTELVGVIIVGASMFANAGSAVLGRNINRNENISPLLVTVISMGTGAVILLASGLLFQEIPRLTLVDWAIVAWLAITNTAFAFTLWNHTQRTLSAVESSIINSTMLIQIAILAWLFLGEGVSLKQGIGMALAALGVVIVQLRRTPPQELRRTGKETIRQLD